MTGINDAEQALGRAVGAVALADAEVDEWLMVVLAALVPTLDVESVRILCARDSASTKIDKVKRLLASRSYVPSEVGEPHAPVEEMLKECREVKALRDQAIHSFYSPHSDRDSEQVSRFRSRSPATPDTSVAELNALADRIRDCSLQLSRLARQLEHLWAEQQSQGTYLTGLLEDCREVVAGLRISSRLGIRWPQETDRLRIALRGYGRWRQLGSDDQLHGNEAEANINLANGQISIRLPGGVEVAGGDTGWRDVTDLAREQDPEVRVALLRRVDQDVRFMQEPAPPETETLWTMRDTLVKRLFPEQSDSPQIPGFLTSLEGFAPKREQGEGG